MSGNSFELLLLLAIRFGVDFDCFLGVFGPEPSFRALTAPPLSPCSVKYQDKNPFLDGLKTFLNGKNEIEKSRNETALTFWWGGWVNQPCGPSDWVSLDVVTSLKLLTWREEIQQDSKFLDGVKKRERKTTNFQKISPKGGGMRGTCNNQSYFHVEMISSIIGNITVSHHQHDHLPSRW